VAPPSRELVLHQVQDLRLGEQRTAEEAIATGHRPTAASCAAAWPTLAETGFGHRVVVCRHAVSAAAPRYLQGGGDANCCCRERDGFPRCPSRSWRGAPRCAQRFDAGKKKRASAGQN